MVSVLVSAKRTCWISTVYGKLKSLNLIAPVPRLDLYSSGSLCWSLVFMNLQFKALAFLYFLIHMTSKHTHTVKTGLLLNLGKTLATLSLSRCRVRAASSPNLKISLTEPVAFEISDVFLATLHANRTASTWCILIWHHRGFDKLWWAGRCRGWGWPLSRIGHFLLSSAWSLCW